MSEVEIRTLEPLSQVELDLLDHVAIWSGVIGTVSFVLVLGVAIYVSVRTRMPGRNFILFSFVSLIAFLGYEQYMGGNLEWVFGPVAALYELIVYCSVFVVFSVGYLKASWCFIRGKSN